jgi:hypothetical protein
MDLEKDTAHDADRTGDDFGCGWSITTLLCGLQVEAASSEFERPETVLCEQSAPAPLIYRVA